MFSSRSLDVSRSAFPAWSKAVAAFVLASIISMSAFRFSSASADSIFVWKNNSPANPVTKTAKPILANLCSTCFHFHPTDFNSEYSSSPSITTPIITNAVKNVSNEYIEFRVIDPPIKLSPERQMSDDYYNLALRGEKFRLLCRAAVVFVPLAWFAMRILGLTIYHWKRKR